MHKENSNINDNEVTVDVVDAYASINRKRKVVIIGGDTILEDTILAKARTILTDTDITVVRLSDYKAINEIEPTDYDQMVIMVDDIIEEGKSIHEIFERFRDRKRVKSVPIFAEGESDERR